MPTGVDRVELAYLRHLVGIDTPLFAIARTTLGFVLLDAAGATAMSGRLRGAVPWGPADRLSLLSRRKTASVRHAESDLRRYALDRCRPRGLGDMLARHLPPGVAYLNTGHSNLTDRMFWSVRHRVDGRISVMIHDTIPLDFPQFQRPGTRDRFRAVLHRVREAADLIICNSAHTKKQVLHHMQGCGELPKAVVAPLGVELPEPGEVPPGVVPRDRYFVALGTIEPRKGHGLLLDVWEDLASRLGTGAPGLVIAGRRGWNNEAVFDRLDRLQPDAPVREIAGLDDAAVAALLVQSRGLLFPSLAEGYGLPPLEAAALGVPVVSSDLPAIREQLGDIPVYADPADRYLWARTVETLAAGRIDRLSRTGLEEFVPPRWNDHFNKVLRLT